MDTKAIGAAIRSARETKGLSQEQLAKRADTDQSTVGRIEQGQFKRLTVTIFRIAEELGARLPGVPARGIRIVDEHGRDLAPPPSLPPPSAAEMDVYGTAEGGDGALILSSDPIETVRRPAGLANVRGAYGVRITGDSMIPAFKPGDIALVHPHLVPRPDDDVVLQRDEHGTRYGIIKTFLRETPSEWRLQQWNPKRAISRSKAEWKECHVVIGKYSRR